MEIYVIVEDGVVANRTEAAEPLAANWIVSDVAQIGWLYDGLGFSPPPTPAFDRAGAGLQIDEAVAAIYGRFTRFQVEYMERETQAQAFKDGGYAGTVPPRVADFCVPAGIPAPAAANLILSQAANLRAAQDQLSALRMRKYEVLRAATDTAAAELAAQLLAQIEVVGGQVS